MHLPALSGGRVHLGPAKAGFMLSRRWTHSVSRAIKILSFPRFPIADQVHFMAFAAFLDHMIFGERFPMVLLFWRQEPGSLTQRAGSGQGRGDRGADKSRPVGNMPELLRKSLIRLECNNFRFMLFHCFKPCHRVTLTRYYFVIPLVKESLEENPYVVLYQMTAANGGNFDNQQRARP